MEDACNSLCLHDRRQSKRKSKNITVKQWVELKIKTLSNVEMILAVLIKNLGTRTESIDCPFDIMPVYFALYTHAVEEYGKFCYLTELRESKGNVKIGTEFFNHEKKFQYAEKYTKSCTELKNESGKKLKVTWDSRLNIFNTDIDDQNNATDIEDNVRPTSLRMAANKLHTTIKAEMEFCLRADINIKAKKEP